MTTSTTPGVVDSARQDAIARKNRRDLLVATISTVVFFAGVVNDHAHFTGLAGGAGSFL